MKFPFKKQTPKQLPVRRRRLTDVGTDNDSAVSGMATFRRNSTITGSSSQHVASATELSGQLQSPRATVHHLHRKRRSFGLLLLGSLVSVGAILFLLYEVMGTVNIALYGQIKPIASSEQQLYRQEIIGYFGKYPLQRLRILLNKDQLAEYLQSQSLTEVKSVASVESDGLGSATVYLKMREPIASWTINSSRQYVDTDGIVFARNYFDQPRVQIRDESSPLNGVDDQVKTVTSRRFLQFIGQTVSYFSQQKRAVQQVIIPASTTRQVIVRLAGGYNIRMTVDRPAGEQSEDAMRTVSYMQRKKIKPEYVDVRVSGRAFYR